MKPECVDRRSTVTPISDGVNPDPGDHDIELFLASSNFFVE